MAHELSIRSNGKVEMAYVGEAGWHGLGQQLQPGATIEEWQRAAGMDWKVCRSRVRFGEGAAQRIYDDQHVLFRSDTKAPLGIVSAKFKVVQLREVLEFFRDLVAGNGFTLDTAGCLFGGRRFWALAKIGEDTVIADRNDKVGGYVLLNSGADGETATTARFTTVRVVCNNTLSMALSEKSKKVVRVTHRTTFDADAVKAQLGIARGQFEQFVDAMRLLSRISVNAKAADRMTALLLQPAIVDAETGSPKQDLLAEVRESKGYRQVMDLFVNHKALGAHLAGVDGTAWGWVNAVTQYIDHGNTGARSADTRMDSAMFGKGDEVKTRAVEIALGTA